MVDNGHAGDTPDPQNDASGGGLMDAAADRVEEPGSPREGSSSGGCPRPEFGLELNSMRQCDVDSDCVTLAEDLVYGFEGIRCCEIALARARLDDYVAFRPSLIAQGCGRSVRECPGCANGLPKCIARLCGFP